MDIPKVAVPTIALAGSADRFPVRRIFCVGRNYAEHAREMGGDPDREPPFFFSKPADAVVESGTEIPFPTMTDDVHHEVELVVALGGGGTDVLPEQAGALIYGYAVGIDLTRRDLQAIAKKAARPWDMAKGFDNSAPIGPLVRAAPAPDAAIALSVDGEPRQAGRLSNMIWSIDEVIAALSTLVELRPGDLIFTGTPAGVGPVRRGQTMLASIEGIPPLLVSLAG